LTLGFGGGAAAVIVQETPTEAKQVEDEPRFASLRDYLLSPSTRLLRLFLFVRGTPCLFVWRYPKGLTIPCWSGRIGIPLVYGLDVLPQLAKPDHRHFSGVSLPAKVEAVLNILPILRLPPAEVRAKTTFRIGSEFTLADSHVFSLNDRSIPMSDKTDYASYLTPLQALSDTLSDTSGIS
jgi:hypothetical protein